MRTISSLGTVAFLALAFGSATTAAQQADPERAGGSVRSRVESYYNAILKGDYGAARDLVAPDARSRFSSTQLSGMAEFQVLDIRVGDEGQSAVVEVRRGQKFANFPEILDYTVKETWQFVDGAWYLMPPPAREGEMLTPFGPLPLPNEQKSPEAKAIEERMRRALQNVDPYQALRALQKDSAKEQETTKSPSEKDKPAEKPAETKPKPPLKPGEKKPS